MNRTRRGGHGTRRGKANDPDFRPLVSIKQHQPTGDLYLGYAFGRGVELKRGTDDWLDMVEILQDLCPGQLGANINDRGSKDAKANKGGQRAG